MFYWEDRALERLQFLDSDKTQASLLIGPLAERLVWGGVVKCGKRLA